MLYRLKTIEITRRPLAREAKCPEVRFGSKADIAASLINVRFTPKSGHQQSALGCPLCAKSRHSGISSDHLVRVGAFHPPRAIAMPTREAPMATIVRPIAHGRSPA